MENRRNTSINLNMDVENLPEISIIIPTYNRADFLAETIESITNQTYQHWELIIVDDGSEDHTENTVKSFADKRIQLIKMEHTGIGSIVKNTGIRCSRGTLITFNDSDDLWAPEKLEKQVEALQQHPEAGFCLTNGYNFKNRDEPLEFFYKKREGFRYDDLFPSCFQSEVAGFTQALMVRRNYLFEVGLFKEIKSFPDVDLIISLSKDWKGIILYEPLVFRRLHDTNHSTDRWEKAYYEGRDVIKQYKTDLPKQIYRNALFRLYMNFGNSCLTRHEKGKAIQQFFKAWQYQPLSLSPLKGIVKTSIHRRAE